MLYEKPRTYGDRTPKTAHRKLPSLRFYRSLCAAKVLLALLRSTLTVLASQMERSLSVRAGKVFADYLRVLHLAHPRVALVRARGTINSLPNTAIMAKFWGISRVAEGHRIP